MSTGSIAEDGNLILIVGVKVSNVMARTRFNEHTNNDPQNRLNSGTAPLYNAPHAHRLVNAVASNDL